MKVFIGGIAVGIANIIPGVSGGTMMVVMGLFNRIMSSVSSILNFKDPNYLDNIKFLVILLAGAVVGLVGFANVIEFLFNNYSTETMWWFIGMVIASIPVFMRKEVQNQRLNFIFVILGIALILGITLLNPQESSQVVESFPAVSIGLLVQMVLVGALGGFTMLLPGVSGSMVLLIFGQYHIFKAYIASVTTFQLNVLIPLAAMALGVAIGILLSAKITKYLLEKSEKSRLNTLSFILGLVVASAFVLIPIVSYSANLIFGCVISFVIGYLMVVAVEKLA